MADRRWAWLMARLLAAGLAVVVLLGQLPRLAERSQAGREASAAFTPLRVEKLTEDRVADAFAALPLEERLLRVGWDHSILSVDLSIDRSSGAPAVVWRDSAKLVRLSFGQLSNVRRLLLRVYAAEDGTRTLLLSGDTTAEDWKSLEELNAGESGTSPAWSGKLNPEWTPIGERWNRYFAKS
ncbi:hypothetical protein [Cohnella zeiphila]|uniref:DUF4825 domain-containing protein n=1 Tax=Cohnella zeiphila TaxID=2761120 RepID=A0A7X0STL8_9BACL|nr:hypothetical protein [Cohnella zeiphila]MBB6735761.1 hypothetical protein [Cohnella zeiphila]